MLQMSVVMEYTIQALLSGATSCCGNLKYLQPKVQEVVVEEMEVAGEEAGMRAEEREARWAVGGEGIRGGPASRARMVMWGGGDTNTGLDNGMWEPGIPILVWIMGSQYWSG